MTDLLMEVVPHAKHAAQVVEPLKPAIQYIQNGVPMLYSVIASAVSAMVGAGLGWYVKGRGMAGVKIDLSNAQNEIKTLKDKLTGSTPTAA